MHTTNADDPRVKVLALLDRGIRMILDNPAEWRGTGRPFSTGYVLVVVESPNDTPPEIMVMVYGSANEAIPYVSTFSKPVARTLATAPLPGCFWAVTNFRHAGHWVACAQSVPLFEDWATDGRTQVLATLGFPAEILAPATEH